MLRWKAAENFQEHRELDACCPNLSSECKRAMHRQGAIQAPACRLTLIFRSVLPSLAAMNWLLHTPVSALGEPSAVTASVDAGRR